MDEQQAPIDRSKTVEVPCTYKDRESPKAILVDLGKGEDTWLPKSQIRGYREDTKGIIGGMISLPYWLAEDKGLT